MADIDYPSDVAITARTDTTLESSDMTFAGCDGSGNPLKTDYSDIKTAILASVLTLSAETIAADDVTPDVSGANVYTTSANTGATEITDLDTPTVGQLVILIGGSATNSSTISDSGNFTLSAAWTAALDAVLVLYVRADNDYIEICRSTN